MGRIRKYVTVNGTGFCPCLAAQFLVVVFALQAPAGFITAASYPVGLLPDGPETLAVGDFNGDGIPDLAVANERGSVTILLGNGDGSFGSPQKYAAGTFLYSIAVGDFNGDGVPDLAVGGDGVNILLGNGDGTFQAPQIYDVNVVVKSLAVGDFNRDGHLDLVLVTGDFQYGDSDKVVVLFGNGDGSFHPSNVNYPVGPGANYVAVADFNRDGIPDLAVVNQGTFDSWTDGSLSILLGEGGGLFQSAQTYPAGFYPWSLAVGDFNGDGTPDIAVPLYDGTVSIFLGNGDGTLGAAQNYVASTCPTLSVSTAAVGDFNGDGKLDLAIANSVADTLTLLLGNGDGTFQTAPVSYAVGGYPRSVAVADFNGDGKLDFAAANPNGNGTVSVLRGNGDGTFRAGLSFLPCMNVQALATGDLNGDGIADVAVAHFSSVSILLGKGDGSFQAGQDYAVGFSLHAVAIGDFNGDGVPDLAVASGGPGYSESGSVSILLGNSDGTFQAAQEYAVGTYPESIVVGDFNGDGILDIVAACRGDGSGNDELSVLLGKGNGTFQAAQNYALDSYPGTIAVGDFNRDGKLDIATATEIVLGNGDGSFQPPVIHSSDGFVVAVGDFNGDNILDLAVSGNGLKILLGNGDGTFRQAVNYTTFPVGRLAVADFNRDGHLDLAVATYLNLLAPTQNLLSVFLGNGDGTFQPAQDFVGPYAATAITTADFNGDGFPDLAVAPGVVILLNGAHWGG